MFKMTFKQNMPEVFAVMFFEMCKSVNLVSIKISKSSSC